MIDIIKLKRVFMAWVLCATFVLNISPLEAKEKEILFINPGYADTGFWHAVSSTMQAAANELGFKLTIVSADRKWPLMISKGLAAIQSTKPDYIILVNEHQQAPTLMAAAEKKGIPTLLLLNDLTAEQKQKFGGPRGKFSNWLGSITPDNVIAGYEMAMAIIEQARSRKQLPVRLLSLAGDFKTPASLGRLTGLNQALNGTMVEVDEVRRLTVNWSEKEAYERTNRLVQTEKVNAVWAANDPIAFGAMKALREHGLVPGRDVFVSGLNWSNEAIDAVIRGEMVLTHGGHFLAGAWSIVLIYDYDNGLDFADTGLNVQFPMSAMSSKPALAYKKALGDRDWSKINFQAFSRQHRERAKTYQFTLKNLLQNIRNN